LAAICRAAPCAAPRSASRRFESQKHITDGILKNKFQLEETLTRNKKKKLKKKRKRHRDILEQQLREIEGMSVDMVDSPGDEQKVFINSNT
jgi:hypothetical protein